MKKTNKRISFDEYDAVHLYEYLRFYWEDYFLENPEDRKQMGEFGKCPQCENIGKRLEKFIGKEEIKEIEGFLKEHRREYKGRQKTKLKI